MGVLQLLGSTLGLGLVSGINLYATVLVVGLGVRLEIIVLRPELQQLQVLATPIVIGIAGLLFVIEFLADKIKWIDSIWDAVHTFIRPLGAALIGATALGATSPEAVVVALLCGGVALSGHSTKAGVRVLVNHSPEAFSNVVLSLVEDGLVVLGTYIAVQYPYLMPLIVGLFVIGFVWFAPKVFRLVRIEINGIFAFFKKLFVVIKRLTLRLLRRSVPVESQFNLRTRPDIPQIVNDELPVEYVYHLKDKFKLNGESAVIRCAAGKGIRGLRHSLGYLTVTPNELIFTARRRFGFRDHLIPRNRFEHIHFKKQLLLDRLMLRAEGKQHVFHFFKDAAHRGESISNTLGTNSAESGQHQGV